MFYFPNLNVVYCPIERTASRSTEKYLFDHDSDGRMLGDFRHSCSAQELDGLSSTKVYATVRHPWDRLCSMFASDKEKRNSGYLTYWEDIDTYLEFISKWDKEPFLLKGNLETPNIFSPMSKLVADNEIMHFYRSQHSYLSELKNVILLRYEDTPSITKELWVNKEITFPEIGKTDNQSDTLFTLGRENRLKDIWPNDFVGYMSWGDR